jgi:hypothetical protein
MAALRFD